MTNGRIKCGLCPAECNNMEEWRNHMAKHTNKQKPLEKLPQRFQCESIVDKVTKRRCGRVFKDLDALLRHRRDEHLPPWIQKSNWMKNRYAAYEAKIDETPEFKYVFEIKRKRHQKIYKPKPEFLVQFHIGPKRKPFDFSGIDPKDPEAPFKIQKAKEEQKTLRRIEQKKKWNIWNSDAANPGDVILEKERPKDFLIPRGVKKDHGREYSVCLHCGCSFRSIEEWMKHTEDVVIPAMRSYSRHHTALKAPNKRHGFKTEKHSNKKPVSEFWEEPDETQTSGKRRDLDQEALKRQMYEQQQLKEIEKEELPEIKWRKVRKLIRRGMTPVHRWLLRRTS